MTNHRLSAVVSKKQTSALLCTVGIWLLAASTQAGTMFVNSGSELSGTGTVNADVIVTSGGRIDPGVGGVGCLSVSSLVLGAGSVLEADVNGPAPCSQHDSVIVSGSAAATQSYLVVTSGGGYVPTPSDELVLLQVGAGGNGLAPFFLNGAPRETALVGGVALSIETNGGDGNDLALFYRRRPSDAVIQSAEVTDDGEIEIRFDIENPGVSSVSSVVATCTGTGSFVTAAGGLTSVTVAGLNSDLSYTCVIAAVNADGSSESLATLPLTPSIVATGLPIWLLYEATQ